MPEFLDLCLDKKILGVLFSSHATHTLQPLDVVLYDLLSGNYCKALITYLHNTLGLLTVKKEDFFPLFWTPWASSFTRENVLSSFKSTEILPM
jgi:hypothetical protein